MVGMNGNPIRGPIYNGDYREPPLARDADNWSLAANRYTRLFSITQTPDCQHDERRTKGMTEESKPEYVMNKYGCPEDIQELIKRNYKQTCSSKKRMAVTPLSQDA